ncbi:putative permease, partial [Ostertagia ostertagi]
MSVAPVVHEPLHLRVNEVPPWSAALMFGFQQAMLCLSGLLVYPFLVSEAVCAGYVFYTVQQWPFLPPLLAYKALRASECPYTEHDYVDVELWQGRLQEISGSLCVACLTFLVIGGTGLAGTLARLIGPVTIVPLMILLTTSIVPTIESKLSLHWISLVMLASVSAMAVYLEEVRVPVPYYSFNKMRVIITRLRLFGQFPVSFSLFESGIHNNPCIITTNISDTDSTYSAVFRCWCGLFATSMTVTDLAHVDDSRPIKNVTMMVLKESPWSIWHAEMRAWTDVLDMWRHVYSSSYLRIHWELSDLLARVSQQKAPPKNAVNRAIMVEGLGSMFASVMGVCTGVTTYAENIALIHVTK